jgi:hypothetical protein
VQECTGRTQEVYILWVLWAVAVGKFCYIADAWCTFAPVYVPYTIICSGPLGVASLEVTN